MAVNDRFSEADPTAVPLQAPAGDDPKRRRRGEPLEEAILDAAWRLAATLGYEALTMDAVALEADTSKPVLYRRWANRAELVLAAMRRHARMDATLPAPGALRDEVLELLRRLVRRHTEHPDLVRGLMKELPLATAPPSQVLLGPLREILDRAAARGEARPNLPARLVSLPLDLVRLELFVTASRVDESVLAEIVDMVFLPLVRPDARQNSQAIALDADLTDP